MSSAPLPPFDEALTTRLEDALGRLSRLIRRYGHSGLTATAGTIFRTIYAQGPLTLGELATFEQVAPSTVTKAVDELEAAGLVRRRVDDRDRRVYWVEATDAAAPKAAELRAGLRVWLAAQLATLSKDEQRRLSAAVDVLEHLGTRGEGA